MQVSEVTFMRRRNLGNYEHTEISATIALVEGDDGAKALEAAQNLVLTGLGINGSKPQAAGSTTTRKASTKTSTNAKSSEGDDGPKSSTKASTTAKTNTGKSTTSKGTAKKTTKDEVLKALQAYAKAKGSKEAAMSILEDVTGVEKLADVDTKYYSKLVKALAV